MSMFLEAPQPKSLRDLRKSGSKRDLLLAQKSSSPSSRSLVLQKDGSFRSGGCRRDLLKKQKSSCKTVNCGSNRSLQKNGSTRSLLSGQGGCSFHDSNDSLFAPAVPSPKRCIGKRLTVENLEDGIFLVVQDSDDPRDVDKKKQSKARKQRSLSPKRVQRRPRPTGEIY